MPREFIHMLLLVVWFVDLDIDNYFALVAFQMARLILYVAWHVILSIGNCDVHV
jgi:NAD/NADP transhydrogenase beta subunit